MESSSDIYAKLNTKPIFLFIFEVNIDQNLQARRT